MWVWVHIITMNTFTAQQAKAKRGARAQRAPRGPSAAASEMPENDARGLRRTPQIVKKSEFWATLKVTFFIWDEPFWNAFWMKTYPIKSSYVNAHCLQRPWQGHYINRIWFSIQNLKFIRNVETWIFALRAPWIKRWRRVLRTTCLQWFALRSCALKCLKTMPAASGERIKL